MLFNRFFAILIDRHFHGKWSFKPRIIFIIEFLHDILHLGLYLAFSYILFKRISFPIHLIREIFISFHRLSNRVYKYLQYRKLISVINTQFPTITKDELLEKYPDRDTRCLICFDEIDIEKTFKKILISMF